MTETWKLSEDQTSATVTGRIRQPWQKKINPLWWFRNDEEPTPPWYMPGKWYRVAAWYARNPLQNFSKYVIGVYDRNYTVTGTAPVNVTAWNDIGDRTGWKFSVISVGWMRLPFASYVGKKWMFYVGTQWWGFSGAKINRLHSSVQIV